MSSIRSLGATQLESYRWFACVEQITIRVRDGKKLTHEGIKVEFVGSIGQCCFSFPLSWAS